MVVFSILSYFLTGFLLSCLYNLFNLIPPPCDMTEDQKTNNVSYCIGMATYDSILAYKRNC